MGRRIRQDLLNAALHILNAGMFLMLNLIMWRNHVWNERRWTTKNVTSRRSSVVGRP